MSTNKRPIETITLGDSSDDEPSPPKNGRTLAEDDDERFERELQAALALSQKSFSANSPAASGSGSRSSTTNVLGDGPSRTEMERERRERQAAREAGGESSAPTVRVGPAVKRAKFVTMGDLAEGGAAPPVASTSASSSKAGFATLGSTESTKKALRFWDGSVQVPANIYVPHNLTHLSFDDVLGPREQMKMAVVSSYCYEDDWLVQHFPAGTPLLLMRQGPEGCIAGRLERFETGAFKRDQQTYQAFVPNRLNEMGGFDARGAMHVKFLILYYKTFCRIVIPSANMMSFDWDQVENAFFIQDFPSHTPDPFLVDKPRENPTHTDLSRPLLSFLSKLKCPKKFAGPFANYDFSASKDGAKLVFTAQGKYVDEDEIAKGGGVDSLAKAVQQLGLEVSPRGMWEIELSGSSIATLSDNWLAQLYAACSGIEPSSYFDRKPLIPSSTPSPLPIKIVYPTLGEVDASHGGQPGGGTLFCNQRTWDNNKKFQKMFCKGVSKRAGVIAHTKIIVAIHKPQRLFSPSKGPSLGFIYVGSHNPTPSAWGRLQNGQQGPQIVNANWEMGVVIAIRGETGAEVEAKATALASFRRPLVPYDLPSDIPWMQ